MKYEKLTINKESESRELITELGLGWEKACLRRIKLKVVFALPHKCRSEKKFIKEVLKRGPNTNNTSIMHLIAQLLHKQKTLIDLPYSLFCHKHSRL